MNSNNKAAWEYAQEAISPQGLNVVNTFIQLKAKTLPEHYFTGFESELSLARMEGLVVTYNDLVRLTPKAIRIVQRLIRISNGITD